MKESPPPLLSKTERDRFPSFRSSVKRLIVATASLGLRIMFFIIDLFNDNATAIALLTKNPLSYNKAVLQCGAAISPSKAIIGKIGRSPFFNR